MSGRSKQIKQYFACELLYGDDFSEAEIEEWFRDERLGYYELVTNGDGEFQYGYHALDMFHGFRYLPSKTWCQVLGIGSAFADELLPILPRISHITILEAAPGFVVKDIRGVPVRYVEPSPTGIFPFPDSHFELITC